MSIVDVNILMEIDTSYLFISRHCRAEAERLAAERLLEEAKALIEDAKIRVDKDEIEVRI